MTIYDDGEASSKKHFSFKVLPLTGFYYLDTVTVTFKGLELELVKILTLFKSVDISSNQFSGGIPSTIGRLSALYMLNVSHNEFIGSIPPSIGNLSQLESLDMSSHKLTEEIPSVLTTLSFLSAFNLSYNQFEGRIPTGAQFQTFTEASYKGNKGLCGVPMNTNCITSVLVSPAPKSQESDDGWDWKPVFYGMAVGSGSTISAFMYSFCKRGTSGRRRLSNLSR